MFGKSKEKAAPVQAEEEQIYHRAKTWQIALTMLFSGANMAFYVLMTYVSYIANAGFGILVATTGIIMTASRLFDGVTDPVIALFIDRFNTRFGKIRILMWMGWGIESVACLLMYVFGPRGDNHLLFFVLVYALYIVGYTFFGVSTNIVGPVMTNDPKQRPRLFRYQTIYSYVFPMILNIVVQVILLPRFGNEYSVPMLGATCIFTIIFAAICITLACVGVSEFDKAENFTFAKEEKDKESKVSLRDMGAFLVRNDAIKPYIVACATDKLASTAGGQAIVTTMLYGILIGNMQLGTIFSVITMIPSILFLLVSTHMAQRRGNKETTVLWTWICIGLGVALFLACAALDMRQITVSILPTILFFGLMLLFNGAKMGVSACSGAMMHDIVDYEMSRTGNFIPGIVTSTYTFIDKVISSFAALIATGCVSLIGYKTVMPQPTDAPTTSIFIVTMFLLIGMPVLGWLATVIAMKFYPLTKEKMVDVQKVNKEIRDGSETVAEA